MNFTIRDLSLAGKCAHEGGGMGKEGEIGRLDDGVVVMVVMVLMVVMVVVVSADL